jgi:hypothetical protein
MVGWLDPDLHLYLNKFPLNKFFWRRLTAGGPGFNLRSGAYGAGVQVSPAGELPFLLRQER